MTVTDISPPPNPINLGRRTVGFGPVSWLMRPRVLLVSAGLTLLGLVLFAYSVAHSEYPMNIADVARILLGGGTRIENVVVFDSQLPRALVSVLVGAGLAMSGALTQTIARNPLATTDFLGVSAGASAGAVFVITLGSGWGLGSIGVPMAALIGGFGAAVAMYVLSWKKGVDPLRMVLVGVALTWALQGVTGYLLTRALTTDAGRAQTWLVGSVSGASWSNVRWAAVVVVAALVVVVAAHRTVAVMALDSDSVRGLGVNASRATAGLMAVAVIVAAVCVSAAGPIAFVALLAPQIAMGLCRTPTAGPVTSGLVGACLVLAGDLVCRIILPVSLPVGVVTAAIGGPVMIYLMIRVSRRGTG